MKERLYVCVYVCMQVVCVYEYLEKRLCYYSHTHKKDAFCLFVWLLFEMSMCLRKRLSFFLRFFCLVCCMWCERECVYVCVCVYLRKGQMSVEEEGEITVKAVLFFSFFLSHPLQQRRLRIHTDTHRESHTRGTHGEREKDR